MEVKYDTIGIDYNNTRKADPYLTERLFTNLDPNPDHWYVDIGCGTGNYTIELKKRGIEFIGIDPSVEMLNKAKHKEPQIQWRIGSAEDTGLTNNSIDGIIATLTIHHWPDLKKGFQELSRVLKPNGNIVIFTSTPEQMRGYWLNHYFPEMLKDSILQMPSREAVTEALNMSGISITHLEKYEVKPDLKDLFLYCGKHNPTLYLIPEVRNGISSFSSLSNKNEVSLGLRQLKEDIQDGRIETIIKSYENDSGDYLFIVGKKTG